jgi:hypothetical protein
MITLYFAGSCYGYIECGTPRDKQNLFRGSYSFMVSAELSSWMVLFSCTAFGELCLKTIPSLCIRFKLSSMSTR